MASKKRCKNCKEYYSKESGISYPVGFFCSVDCASVFAIKKSEEKKAKAISKLYLGQNRKPKNSKSELATRKRAAREACHAYIRERDKDNSCICCDKPLGKVFHAGHYLESGNNPRIRYDENNIHGQKIDCNTHKGGDSGMYRVNLIKKIGLAAVEKLESMKGGTVKRTPDDYRKIEQYYKDKLKQLLSNRKI